MKKILIVGASLSGNVDGPAILDTFIENIQELTPDVRFTMLSKYPKDDLPLCKKKGIQGYSFTTIYQLIVGSLFFVLGSLRKLLGLPPALKLMPKQIREYYENDICVDLTGISFSDDRPFSSLVINTLWLLNTKVSGIPTVKTANSMGPFRKWYVRIVGKWVLKDISVLVARGDVSYQLVKELLPSKEIYNLPDIAFGLEPAEKERISALLNKHGLEESNYAVIGPSYVMNRLLGQENNLKIYTKMVSVIKGQEPDIKILLVPHSRKHSTTLGVDDVSDDCDICRLLKGELEKKGIHAEVLDEILNPHEVKGVIGAARYAIGSRYHLLIAALSSATPCMALGWNHKYEEAFQLFNCSEWVIRHEETSEDMIAESTLCFIESVSEIQRRIERTLPEVVEKAKKNATLVYEMMERKNQ